MNHRKFILRVTVCMLSVALVLALLEIGVRGYDYLHRNREASLAKTPPIPLHVVTNNSYLYGLNPDHPDISAQATRDDEVAIPKPRGTFRILLLGDSIAYGSFVPRSETFPNLLEKLLRQQLSKAEVVNAGVMGYTPYNELHYYLEKGRDFDADVVVVAFCMNDVVNPRLHWGDAPGVKIPTEAIPNLEYDRNHILPMIEQNARLAAEGPRLVERSELYRRLKHLFTPRTGIPGGAKTDVPTYITGEDTISIEVLLNRSTPEWQWLSRQYDQLNEAVRKNGAKLVVTILPLAYQLDPDYPYLPQNQILEYCRERSIPCLDLLPAFKKYPKEQLFLLNQEGFYDIWHLTKEGHEKAAAELWRFLEELKLHNR